MTSSRLETAVDEGLVEWPEGQVLALRAPADSAGLPTDRLTVQHGFFPEIERWRAQNVPVAPDVNGEFDAAYLAIPRSRSFAFRQIAEAISATRPGALILIDGQKTDGIDSIFRQCRNAFEVTDSLTKAHGRLFWFSRPEDIPAEVNDWRVPKENAAGWFTSVAGFSADGPDKGSKLLAEHLPAKLSGRILDLGAGWGFLANQILKNQNVSAVDLLEAEFEVLEAARRNIEDPRARFLWADAQDFDTDQPYDTVVCNPPFHSGRAPDPELGRAFLKCAARVLRRNGLLALVANRHLPYERTLTEQFTRVETIAEAQGFKVIHAQGPKGAHRRG